MATKKKRGILGLTTRPKVSEPSKLKTFVIIAKTTGRAEITVEAETAEEAKRLMWLGEAESEKQIEWEYDSIEGVEEQK